MEEPNKEQIEFDKKISEHLAKWYKMNRSRFVIQGFFSVIGYIILYAFLVISKGFGFGNEYIWEILVTLLVIGVFGFAGYFIWLAFVKIPQEIIKEERQNLEQHQKKSLDMEPEIIFHNMSCHDEFSIEGATPEQVMNYIRNSISTNLWNIRINNKIYYEVDRNLTKFCDPQKDNTLVNGIIFHGIKYDLEQKETGQPLLKSKNGVKIPEMFTISIDYGGLGDKVKLFIKFNTQTKDVYGFFNEWVKRELGKEFTIKENSKEIADNFKQPFEIRRTKSMFIGELRNFAKQGKSELELFSRPIMILLHRRTDNERKLSSRNDEWDIIQNVAEANAVKLTQEPYRGLLLEITEKESGLWIVVNPEGDTEPVDFIEKDGSWRNMGSRYVDVNQLAYVNLLQWLDSLQGV